MNALPGRERGVNALNTNGHKPGSGSDVLRKQVITRGTPSAAQGKHRVNGANGANASDAGQDPAPEAEQSWLLGLLTRWSWVAVLVVALGISWWSLFTLALMVGIPTVLAAGLSVVFDAAALVCARLAHRYSASPDSGAGPRVVMLGLVAGSVYLNWNHAVVSGYGTVAAVMFAAPAVVAVLLFELESGWRSRTARRARGRVSEPLPMIGRWGWLFHPVQSVVTVWRVSSARGRAVRNRELARIAQESDPQESDPQSTRSRIRALNTTEHLLVPIPQPTTNTKPPTLSPPTPATTLW